MTTITDCTNRRAHRHTLTELRSVYAHADTIPRNLIDKFVELHEQPDARKQYRTTTNTTVPLRDLFAFVRTYRPVPIAFRFPVTSENFDAFNAVYKARAAAAEAMLLADEVVTARQLNITVEALRDQHWHTTNNAMDRTEKRETLALLRAGLLTGHLLERAIRRWGSTAWEDLATFREPDAPQSARRPGNRSAAPDYRRFRVHDVENENFTLGWPRDPATAKKRTVSAPGRAA
ncbi:hypothetical protein [Curtobacterium sp. PhB136]|uniref:hypothetical protein n=1 Tax=Curtobacterium sp. PhB136 TaxID=2485181 RepID=UPI0010522A68|nr:hypothetical protein [Curtobacterium sp. PhB136]TCK59264.1 hypothetical protein EDF27_3786 [Curtobacterium sp. PhB136]